MALCISETAPKGATCLNLENPYNNQSEILSHVASVLICLKISPGKNSKNKHFPSLKLKNYAYISRF